MQTDEFVRRVQEEVNLSLGGDALQVVEATLATLGERLGRDERRALAAQLPQQLKTYALTYEETSRYHLEEFYNRVAARAGVSRPEAVDWSRAVLSVLRSAVTAGQMEKIRQTLPDEFEELFTGEAMGPGSPGHEVAR
ncbi:MAG TPA: DUF2267 domain-containing protein [Candidatus Sulfomarinibacteraceae bacterium]|nr:DUF2267 domain-containing protein [Candidatus Sulfomarinibacteraceae bacterium]